MIYYFDISIHILDSSIFVKGFHSTLNICYIDTVWLQSINLNFFPLGLICYWVFGAYSNKHKYQHFINLFHTFAGYGERRCETWRLHFLKSMYRSLNIQLPFSKVIILYNGITKSRSIHPQTRLILNPLSQIRCFSNLVLFVEPRLLNTSPNYVGYN